MTANNGDLSERERRLQEALVACIEPAERGQAVDRDAILARYPEFAVELNEFFANSDSINRLAAPLKASPSIADAPTVGPGEAAPVSLAPGARVGYFGDYELLEEIGRGGMGVVYRARQKSLNRTVALKMILSGQLAHDEDVRRFHAEAEAAARLDHPGIVTVYEVGQHEGQHYFSMAFVEGQSLAHRLAQGLPSPREGAELTRKVAEAVAYAHVEGVIHRDLKPGNILIDKHGQPRLTDFGLAKRVEGEHDLTATGQILGTPSYMPPEQAGGRRGTVGPLSDVYSLGGVLYCLLTGRPPFQSDNPLDTLLQVLDREPVPPRQLNVSVPRDLETICLKCLQKEPRRRYGSAQDLAADLERFLKGEPIRARPVGVVGKAWRWCRRNPALATAAAVTCLAVVSTVVLSVNFALHQAQVAERDRRLLAESYLDRGQNYCEQGDVARGLLWFARGLEKTPAGAGDLERAIRLNLAAWRPRPPEPRLVLERGREVWVVAPSADGRAVLLSGADFVARLYSLETGKPIGAAVRHNSLSVAVALSPDGKTIATGMSEPGVTAVLWDAATGNSIRALPSAAGGGDELKPAQRVAFSADGKVLATSDITTVQLWDAADGKPIGSRMRGHTDWIEALALSRDGKLVATGSRDGTAIVWDAATGKPLHEPLVHPFGTWVGSLAFHPDGSILLTGCHHGNAFLWDVKTGQLLREPIYHPGWVWAVAFSPDGRRILTGTGGDDNTARVWETATGRPIGLPLRHGGYVNAVAFGPDGKTAITANKPQSEEDATARVWDLPEDHPAERILPHADPVLAVAFSPDGHLIATGTGTGNYKGWRGEARLWDAATGKPLGEPLPLGGSAPRLVFSPDGKTLATASSPLGASRGKWGWEPAVRLWDVATGQPKGQPLVHDRTVAVIAFSADGQTVTTTDEEGTIRDWDLGTGKEVGEAQQGQRPNPGAARSPDGHWVMTNGEDNLGFLYPASDINPAPALRFAGGQVQPPGGVTSSAFSPDSTLVATAGGAACLWDVVTRKAVGPTLGQANAVAFSPNGETLVTGGKEGARLWRVPRPVEGDPRRIKLWVEALTGSELVVLALRGLRGEDLVRRNRELEEAGGPP